MSEAPRILYCHCAHAQVVPKEVKEAVLRRLAESGLPFEAVADLCELSARRDPLLARLAGRQESDSTGPVGLKIAACYPRAVKWLFSAAEAALPADQTEVLNMRIQTAEAIAESLLSPVLHPNVPTGKVTAEDAPSATANPVPTASVSPA